MVGTRPNPLPFTSTHLAETSFPQRPSQLSPILHPIKNDYNNNRPPPLSNQDERCCTTSVMGLVSPRYKSGQQPRLEERMA